MWLRDLGQSGFGRCEIILVKGEAVTGEYQQQDLKDVLGYAMREGSPGHRAWYNS